MELEEVLECLGFNRSSCKILSHLVHNPGFHDIQDIVGAVGVTRPMVASCLGGLGHFVERQEGRKAHYAALPAEEIQQKLLFMLDRRESELQKLKSVVLEGF
jgi:sugar-specific transcriptional regulator TrmB